MFELNLAGDLITNHPILDHLSNMNAPIQSDYLSEETNRLHRFMQSFPLSQAIVWLRRQYFDEILHQQIASGCKQVVILNAGLDTYTDRLINSGIRYFEVSQPAIIRYKLAQASCNQGAAATTYIAENYLQPNLIELLQHYQFDVHLPTFFVWAGSIPSLKRSDIIALLEALRNQVCQFHLSFDYLSHQTPNSSSNPEFNQSLDRLDHLGLNWITTFKDISTFTRGLGLELLETYSLAELHDRACPQFPLPSSLLHFYCVCTIAKQVLRW